MTAPFTGQGWTTVQIRVAAAIVRRDYNRNPMLWASPARRLFVLSQDATIKSVGFYSSFLLSWSVALDRGPKTLSGIIADSKRLSLEGHNWRRCAFPAYKAHRRDDPRVTNRGVKTLTVSEQIALGYRAAQGEAVNSDD